MRRFALAASLLLIVALPASAEDEAAEMLCKMLDNLVGSLNLGELSGTSGAVDVDLSTAVSMGTAATDLAMDAKAVWNKENSKVVLGKDLGGAVIGTQAGAVTMYLPWSNGFMKKAAGTADSAVAMSDPGMLKKKIDEAIEEAKQEIRSDTSEYAYAGKEGDLDKIILGPEDPTARGELFLDAACYPVKLTVKEVNGPGSAEVTFAFADGKLNGAKVAIDQMESTSGQISVSVEYAGTKPSAIKAEGVVSNSEQKLNVSFTVGVAVLYREVLPNELEVAIPEGAVEITPETMGMAMMSCPLMMKIMPLMMAANAPAEPPAGGMDDWSSEGDTGMEAPTGGETAPLPVE